MNLPSSFHFQEIRNCELTQWFTLTKEQATKRKQEQELQMTIKEKKLTDFKEL